MGDTMKKKMSLRAAAMTSMEMMRRRRQGKGTRHEGGSIEPHQKEPDGTQPAKSGQQEP
jgi:hypothetical protein